VGLLLTWPAAHWMGVIGLLLTLPFWAHAFAPDLVALAGLVRRGARQWLWRAESGQHYAFKGQPLRVLDDELERRRWIHVGDLALALEEPISLSGLRLRHAAGLQELGDGAYLSDEAALAYLAERRAERAVLLRRWVEREVWFPARGGKAQRR